MNGGLRFLGAAFLLAFCYHWLIDNNWSDMEEEKYNEEEDFVKTFSQTFQPPTSNQIGKGDKEKFKSYLEDFQSREFQSFIFCCVRVTINIMVVYFQILGQVLLEEIHHSCLPRLVCELFAMEDKSSLSESELSLMTLISQTSLGTRASPSSNYHFAAHMGQLLVGIDGNKCQNFYPACPLAGNQALALARKIKIR